MEIQVVHIKCRSFETVSVNDMKVAVMLKFLIYYSCL